jgi:flagellar motor component MotA
MRQVQWQMVVLILGLSVCMTGVIIVLAINNKDVSAVLSAVSVFILAIVGALGWSAKSQIESKVDVVSRQTDSVKDLTNGQQAKLMDMIKDLHDKLSDLQEKNTALALGTTPPPPSQSPEQQQ